ncbi:MAG: branched-chain amino acid ABC transporter permease [Candidatus Brocadiae bacterium]|nr:branched-chain amino acid ABC transporter permease [Candidatus Brocadiia bacterium]
MNRWREHLPLLAALGVALVLPLLPFSEPTSKRLISVSGFVFIFVVLALGLNIVPGWTGLLDLGYVAFVAIGAYTVAILTRLPWMQFEGAWFLALLAAGAHAALWGTLRLGYAIFPAVGALTWGLLARQPWVHFPWDHAVWVALALANSAFWTWRLRWVFRTQLAGDYFAIVTFAFAQILLIFIQNCTPVTNAARGYSDFPAIRIGGHATGTGTLPPGTIVVLPDGKGSISAPDGGTLVFPRGGADWAPVPQVPLEVTADVKLWLRGLEWVNLPSGAAVIVPEAGYAYEPPGRAIEPDSKGFYYLLLAFVVVVFLAVERLHRSRLGRAWLAMKADEISAKANGISIPRHRMIAFAVSGFIGGLGGALQAWKIEIVTPGSYDFWVSVLILSCVVLGGMGSLRGVVIGTIALISLGEVLREGVELGPGLSSFFMNHARWLENIAWQPTGDHALLKVPDQARYLVFGAILVLVMIFRPQGLLPPRGARPPITPEEASRLRGVKTALFREESK